MMCLVLFYNCSLLRHVLIFEYFLRLWETGNLSKEEDFLSCILIKYVQFYRAARMPLGKATLFFCYFSASEKQDVHRIIF